MRALALLLFLPALVMAGRGEELLRAIRETGLDANECYRVREISLVRDEAQFYFTDGYLIFGKAVGGTRVTALFSADVEGGEAELLLLPPNRSERRALAAHTGSPNLEEHFHAALMVFADDTYQEILAQIRANPYNKKSGEMGALLADKWTPMARDLTTSFSPRLAVDLLSSGGGRKGFFAAALAGDKLGALDLVFDARVPEQILLGAMSKGGFELWSSFASRSFRSKPYEPEFGLRDYRIVSTLDADLTLHCVTRVKVETKAAEGALPFEISQSMNVTSALIDGAAADVLRNGEGVRDTSGNQVFLIVPSQPLGPGVHEVEIHHEGTVIADAGNHVYFVGSRGNWYPGRGMQFATFDLTFRSPGDLDLVATGDPVEDRLEDGQRITRRRTTVPIRLAGFNLGVYDRAHVARNLFTIEVCANHSVEDALQPRVPDITWTTLPAGPVRPNRRPAVELPAAPPPSVHTSRARLEALASDLGDVMTFYAARFGPPPLHHLEVSPVPGRFGQGFPGMIYLSTTSYLPARSSMSENQQIFFSDLLHAHEAAHQWWGSMVTSAGYHDDWIMESLANYSALLYVEKTKGAKALDLVLEDYRLKLLAKDANGKTRESAGPIVQGLRLNDAWQAIVYGKGTWIIHMLRKRLGDDAFAKMLTELRRQFEYKSVTTEQFRIFCAGFLPPKSLDPKLEAFFDQWVYGTGIPALKLNYKVHGLQVSGTVAESGVSDDFFATVPLEIQAGRGKPVVRMVRSASEPEPFEFKMAAVPAKVAIDLRSILHQ